MNTRSILEERGSRYGDFKTHAEITVELKDAFSRAIWRRCDNVEDYDNLFPPYMQEAVDMIMHKLGRIANGDPFYDDSWIDIAGYAQLVVDELRKGTKE